MVIKEMVLVELGNLMPCSVTFHPAPCFQRVMDAEYEVLVSANRWPLVLAGVAFIPSGTVVEAQLV